MVKRPPKVLGPFDLERRIGAGAFGQVFKARNRSTGEVVAVKSLRPSATRDMALLKREFREAAELVHENLVKLYELYDEDGECFFSMELLEGTHVSPKAIDTAVDANLVARLLLQGGAALNAMHQAGLVHRDIKPSNMILTDAGRLVFLDFGLLERSYHASQGFAGSLPFAAPEVVKGAPHRPESDWFSLGAVLVSLFNPDAADPLDDTVRAELSPGDADEVEPARVPIPDPWRTLLSELTDPEPSGRPSYQRVLEVVREELGEDAVRAGWLDGLGRGDGVLVGRESELDELHERTTAPAGGGTHVVYLRGTSGVGKSALLRKLAERLREGQHTVAYSACREGDRTAHRVLDTAMDELIRSVPKPALPAGERRVARAMAARLLPCLERAGFGDPSQVPELDAASLRRLGVRGLREILSSLDRGSLVLLLDDLQWGDSESGRLLADVLGEGDLDLTVVFATRPEDDQHSEFLEMFEARSRGRELVRSELVLGPLGPDSAKRLVELHAAGADRDGEAIARAARGNPFHIQLLARVPDLGNGTLQEVVGTLVETLSPPHREALEVLSIATGPVAGELVGEVLGGRPPLVPLWRKLQELRLVRTLGTPESRLVTPYHDSVRETVRDGIEEARRRELHLATARELSRREDLDDAVIGHHYRAAGRASEAAPHLAKAAREAVRSLALPRAVELYEQALEGTAEAQDLAQLELEHLNALAAAGFSERAGTRAVELMGRRPRSDRPHLRRVAVEQFFIGGHVDRGRPLALEMLEEVGRSLPRSPLWSEAALYFHIARTVLGSLRLSRGFGPLALGRATSPAVAVDFAVGRGLASYDPIVGSLFLIRAAASAMGERDLETGAIGLAYAGAAVGFSGRGRDARLGLWLIDIAQRQSRNAGYVRGDAFAEVSRGVVKACQGLWRESIDCFDRGVVRLDRECAAADWEANNGKNTSLFSLMNLGDVLELSRRVRRHESDARDRSDLALEVESSLYHAFALLAHDDPGAAGEHVRATISKWTNAHYHFQHWIAARLDSHRACYEGASAAELEAMEDALRSAKKAGLTKMRVVVSEGNALIGRLALSRMDAEGTSAPLVRTLRRCIKNLAGLDAEHATARAAGLRAGLALREGNREVAIDELRAARHAFARAEMAGESGACAVRLAELGAIPAEEGERAFAELRELGIESPERWARMLAPIC